MERSEFVASLDADFGEDPQDVGADPGTEDDFGDLVSAITSFFAERAGASEDYLFLTVDRVASESDAETMDDLVAEVEKALGL